MSFEFVRPPLKIYPLYPSEYSSGIVIKYMKKSQFWYLSVCRSASCVLTLHNKYIIGYCKEHRISHVDYLLLIFHEEMRKQKTNETVGRPQLDAILFVWNLIWHLPTCINWIKVHERYMNLYQGFISYKDNRWILHTCISI